MYELDKLKEYVETAETITKKAIEDHINAIEYGLKLGYMELPLDTNEEPIHVGDSVASDGDTYVVRGVTDKNVFVDYGARCLVLGSYAVEKIDKEKALVISFEGLSAKGKQAVSDTSTTPPEFFEELDELIVQVKKLVNDGVL